MKEHDRRYEQRFQAQADLLMQAIRSSDKALTKAEAATESRLAGMNEFRQTLDDYSRTLISRDEVVGEFKFITERVEAISGRVSALEKQQAAGGGGAAAQARGWAYLVGGVGLLFVIVQLFLILR